MNKLVSWNRFNRLAMLAGEPGSVQPAKGIDEMQEIDLESGR